MIPLAVRRRARALGFVLAFLASAHHAHAAGTPRRIVLLQSWNQANLTFSVLTDGLRAELARQFTEPVNFIELRIHPAGFTQLPEEASVAYISSVFSDRQLPDLVVAIGASAASFAQKHRSELFPGAPLMLTAIDERLLETTIRSDIGTVPIKNDASGAIANILRLLPRTKHVFVVLGASPVERTWREQIERVVPQFSDRVDFSWSNQLSFTELKQSVATLPLDSAILFVWFNVDIEGGEYSEERALTELHAAAHAPMFGVRSTQLGHGIVGGPLLSIDRESHTTAVAASRILHGEPAGSVHYAVQEAEPPVYDWRELRRWHISESRLPAGSTVLFREPTPWERNKWLLLGGGTAVFAEALLILGLFVSLAERQRAERSLRESEERWRLIASSAPVMIWMSGTDKLCTDVNRLWLDFTGRSLEMELGTGWTESLHRDDVPNCLATYTEAFDRREPFRMEYRLRRFDGEYRWMLDSGVPRFGTTGSFLGYIGSVVDVTDQKAAREALSSLSRRLMDTQERERSRVARELHDDVGQRVAILAIELNVLSESLLAADVDARERLSDLSSQASALGTDIQAISRGLHSSKLEHLGIASAARTLCDELSAQHRMTIDLRCENLPTRFPSEVALALFRVLQEAANNAIKHSGVEHFAVAITGTADAVHLSVEDLGNGFDVKRALARHGLGLISMQERVNLAGGEIVLRSAPGAGTSVRVRIPLRQTVDAKVAHFASTVEQHG